MLTIFALILILATISSYTSHIQLLLAESGKVQNSARVYATHSLRGFLILRLRPVELRIVQNMLQSEKE